MIRTLLWNTNTCELSSVSICIFTGCSRKALALWKMKAKNTSTYCFIILLYFQYLCIYLMWPVYPSHFSFAQTVWLSICINGNKFPLIRAQWKLGHPPSASTREAAPSRLSLTLKAHWNVSERLVLPCITLQHQYQKAYLFGSLSLNKRNYLVFENSKKWPPGIKITQPCLSFLDCQLAWERLQLLQTIIIY